MATSYPAGEVLSAGFRFRSQLRFGSFSRSSGASFPLSTVASRVWKSHLSIFWRDAHGPSGQVPSLKVWRNGAVSKGAARGRDCFAMVV